jgi:ribosomal protein L29
MVSDNQAHDKSSLEELVKLLVERTAEYIELMAEKNADGAKLRDLKLQIENLRVIISHRRSSNQGL